MQLSVRFENTRDRDGPAETGEDDGPVTVGWVLNPPTGGIIYSPPERVRTAVQNRTHAKSAARCPAVLNLESRYFLIRCPYDINIGFARDKEGRAVLRNLGGDLGAVRQNKLAEKLHLTAEAEWRHKDVPTIQLSLPYVFVSDAPVYASQVAPFMHFRRTPLPGTVFGGRFPINVWPRPFMWAFEWHEPDKPLRIERGEPLFYVGFETLPQDRGVVMLEAALTPELTDYLAMIAGAVNYVSQTFSLFAAAEARRPARLVTPVRNRRAAR